MIARKPLSLESFHTLSQIVGGYWFSVEFPVRENLKHNTFISLYVGPNIAAPPVCALGNFQTRGGSAEEGRH